MRLLIGNTGLIGTTLKDSLAFDHEFNSSNIETLRDLEVPVHTDIYLSCLPATKWKVNQDPQQDLENILNIIEILSSKAYRNIILYSTIDVYNASPQFSNEDTIPKMSTLNYGSNRYLFEVLVRNNLKYAKLTIMRLPALFGKHIKKNILYDLLNNNQVDKIQKNSKFQWYNLNNLVADTEHLIKSVEPVLCINLFSEPINTSDILDLFPDAKKVDIITPGIEYDYRTKFEHSGYFKSAVDVLRDIKNFVSEYKLLRRNIRIAVCLFGEQRDLINRLPYWKTMQNQLHHVDFYIATYVNPGTEDLIRTLKSEIKLKDYYIAYNDLVKFDKLKYSATTPIYIYKTDVKATVDRLMSQLYIRQKAIELIDFDSYDVILMCRTDSSELTMSINDIIMVADDKNMLIASTEQHHIHPGGGGGCSECTSETRCTKEFHANDICDLWCIGSTDAMRPWKTIYLDAFKQYESIQKTSLNINDDGLNHITIRPELEQNEIHITFPIQHINMIENDIHCFYPEKIMRVAFKDVKILNSNN